MLVTCSPSSRQTQRPLFSVIGHFPPSIHMYENLSFQRPFLHYLDKRGQFTPSCRLLANSSQVEKKMCEQLKEPKPFIFLQNTDSFLEYKFCLKERAREKGEGINKRTNSRREETRKYNLCFLLTEVVVGQHLLDLLGDDIGVQLWRHGHHLLDTEG